ncbi:Crp/Fnr family transcriptional regulator [Pseudonocardia sp. MH-G8]|nr:Crp/Fnr family transcriptional regulator [Pseudonocardia sp. MH-G8]
MLTEWRAGFQADPVPQRRRAHEAWLLEHLRRHGRASRAELVDATGLSRATVSALTADLLAAGKVVVTETPDPGRLGRTPQSLALNPAAGLVLGLDFGHTRVGVVAADAAHEIVGSATRPYPRSTPWETRCAIAVRLARKVLGEQPDAALAAVGIGIAGSISDRPAVVEAIREAFTAAFGVAVRTDNNARLAGLAESVWGAARGTPDVLYVRLSSGVGGAVILDGRVHRGRGDTAGEFGHVCLDPTGPLCRCSNRGCLECYVRVESVLAHGGVTTVAGLAEALDRDEPRARAAVTEAGQRIGLVLAGAGSVLDVATVVLGGDLAALREHLVRPVRQTLARHLHPDKVDDVTVRTAELGDLDGALGGVALVLHDPSIAFTGPLSPRHLPGSA